jgi:malic enzyme
MVSGSRRVTDSMLLTAARTLASHVSDSRLDDGAIYPEISGLRDVSRAIAVAVASDAMRTGDAPKLEPDRFEVEVASAMWWPAYVPYTRAEG